MKISYSWLKDYVAIKLSPEKLAERLTLLGLEVVSSENSGEETVLEIEVTANRPDCLNYIGIARELAAATNQKLKIPPLSQKAKAAKGKFIQIEDKNGCPQYIGKIIEGCKVGASAAGLQKKLKDAGLRPVNNIVDITNFLLMELGQPMHTFDLDKLAGKKIIVRRARPGEIIVTIDGIERKLDPEILVISDDKKPVAIAGVMGGKETEVNEYTRNILLESAYFNPIVIHRTCRKLGLASESSYRFERKVDVPMVTLASNRAINLMLQTAGGKLTAVCDIDSGKAGLALKIALNSEKAATLLGQEITAGKIKSILGSLGLKVSSSKGKNFKVTIPSFRSDLKEEVDLVEELARHVGFDRLPLSLPAIKISRIPEQPIRKLTAQVREIMVATGLSEIIGYSLINEEDLKKLNWDGTQPVRIQNPLSRDQEIMRPTLLTGLLSAMQNNLSHNLTDVKIFEIAKAYQEECETLSLSIGLMGEKSQVSLWDLKGRLEVLVNKLRITGVEFSPQPKNFFAAGKAFAITIDQQAVGFLGELSPAAAASLDFKHQQIFLAELNLEALLRVVKWERKVAPLINFPLIRRDISLIIKEEVSGSLIVDLLQKEAGPLLINTVLTDRYSGAQIPAGFKGLTYSLEFQAPDRTLSDNEANAIHEKLCNLLVERLAAKIRR
jgi:phenylalanyl-tRNA synthetase beta chain